MNKRHFIVIPAYNEEKRIEKTVKDYAKHFGANAEILIVLNGCRDRTGDIVRNLIKEYSNTGFIEFSEAVGKGRAVQEGFKYASSKFKVQSSKFLIGFADADEATRPEEYERLAGLMGDADGVIGSRFMKGAKVSGRSFLRSLIGYKFRLIVKLLFDLKFADTQCGVKIFRAEALKKILPELKVANMAFDVEMLLMAHRQGLKLKEIATVWDGKTESGALGSPFNIIKNGWIMFWTLIKLKYGK